MPIQTGRHHGGKKETDCLTCTTWTSHCNHKGLHCFYKVETQYFASQKCFLKSFPLLILLISGLFWVSSFSYARFYSQREVIEIQAEIMRLCSLYSGNIP